MEKETFKITLWAKTLIYLGEMTFTVALTVGTVKGAQNLTSRALGL